MAVNFKRVAGGAASGAGIGAAFGGIGAPVGAVLGGLWGAFMPGDEEELDTTSPYDAYTDLAIRDLSSKEPSEEIQLGLTRAENTFQRQREDIRSNTAIQRNAAASAAVQDELQSSYGDTVAGLGVAAGNDRRQRRVAAANLGQSLAGQQFQRQVTAMQLDQPDPLEATMDNFMASGAGTLSGITSELASEKAREWLAPETSAKGKLDAEGKRFERIKSLFPQGGGGNGNVSYPYQDVMDYLNYAG